MQGGEGGVQETEQYRKTKGFVDMNEPVGVIERINRNS